MSIKQSAFGLHECKGLGFYTAKIDSNCFS
jgi:hypothetical protein